MHILRQVWILLFLSFLGELVRGLLPFPIPAGIYGFVIFFICLMTGIIKVHQVKDVSNFLVENLQIIILPACMEIVSYWPSIQSQALKFFAIAIVSTLVVTFVTGKVCDLIISLKERRHS